MLTIKKREKNREARKMQRRARELHSGEWSPVIIGGSERRKLKRNKSKEGRGMQRSERDDKKGESFTM